MSGQVVNFIAFQIGWLSAVAGAGRGRPVVGIIVVALVVVLHLARSPQPAREAKFLCVVALLGTAVDSLFASSNLVLYRGGYGATWIAPAWITAMWLNFGTTIHASLGWLAGRYGLSVVLGAVAGPLAYFAAARLGAVELTQPPWSYIALALAWAVALPALFRLSRVKAFRLSQ